MFINIHMFVWLKGSVTRQIKFPDHFPVNNPHRVYDVLTAWLRREPEVVSLVEKADLDLSWLDRGVREFVDLLAGKDVDIIHRCEERNGDIRLVFDNASPETCARQTSMMADIIETVKNKPGNDQYEVIPYP